MRRSIKWAFVAALGLFGLAVENSPSKTPHSEPPAGSRIIDLARPVYLAEDAVRCAEVATLGAYMDGQQRGGKSEGHNAVAALFVHPKEGCVRVISRSRVTVLDAKVESDRLVKVQCPNIGYGDRCNVRPSDLSN